MTIWFTSDMHLGHSNIIELSKRPFKDIEDMDKQLINNWNSRVKPNDTIYHLGDFCFRNIKKFNQYFHNLNGHIIFIQGNHDHNNGVNSPILDMTIHYGGENLLLIHNPSDVTCFGGKLVLCGHVHQNWRFQRNYYDDISYLNDAEQLVRKLYNGDSNYTDFCNVGVDVNAGYPVNIQEILKYYNIWKKNGDQCIKKW